MAPPAASVVNGRRSAKQSRSTPVGDFARPAKYPRARGVGDTRDVVKQSQAKLTEADESAPKRSRVGDPAVERPAVSEPARHRPRRAAQDLLQDCILGYIDDESGDPPRSGTTKYRQSKEITEMIKVDDSLPIAKEHRSEFVWVAAVRLPDGRRKYTWDADVMTPLPRFEVDDDNTCDVCGACCIEVLYEFRCYSRIKPGAQATSREGRRLHPSVAYISKECGRGLLGVQSEASKLREQLYRVISADPEQAVETLRELWRVANKTQQSVITDELRHFAGIEIGESDRVAELRNAEATHGALHKGTDDVFRAAARSLGAVLSVRELASAAARMAIDAGVTLRGHFASVVSALQNRQPLPIVETPWPKDDVRESLAHFVRAWPVRVELLDSLSKPESFGDQGGQVVLRLVYLHGCGELHALANESVDRESALALRADARDILGQCNAAFKLRSAHGVAHRTHWRKEDGDILLPEGEISSECVRAALDALTWPDCTTRGNVVPEGTSVISAFPLGVVNNYAIGLMCSKATLIRPKLTRLLTRFLAQNDPDFCYTTIQLNRNYSARMHVDGNNDGPSYIIALGEYTGGELWVYDEKHGDVEMELKEQLKGWAHFKAGTKLRGRLVDIKNKWFAFNGTIPHMALPFKGCRMSIVYFSRKRWQTMKEDVVQQLEGLDFSLPRASKVPLAPSADLQDVPQQQAEEDLEDEIDEVSSEDSSSEEEGGQGPGQAAHDWAVRFKARLGCMSLQPEQPRSEARRVVLLSCHAGLGVPALALKELLPSGDCRILCVSEAEEGAVRFAKSNCQPEYAFQDLNDVVKGQGHCEVRHRNAKLPSVGDRDLTVFAGGFHISVFVGLETRSARQALQNGSFSDPYYSLHRCIRVQRPCVALLEIRGLSELPQAQQSNALRSLLDGIDCGDAEPAWGLRQLGSYGIELVQLRSTDFGLPLADTYAFAVLVREDCGGQASAELAMGLARGLRGLLPRTTAGELLLESSSKHLLQIVKSEWKRTDRASDSTDTKTKMQLAKTFAMEAKELGISPGQAPYSDLLFGELGVQEKEWYPHASANQKIFLNLAYRQATRAGADLDSMVVDLSQGIRSQPWRDDGLLPAVLARSQGGGALHYSFNKHRPLTSAEVLGCHGMPAVKLDVHGVGDVEAARLASSAVPLPVFGAVLCAALAVAELDKQPALLMPPGRAAELVALGPEAPDELSTSKVMAHEVEEASEDLQFGGRAAVLLNLVRHDTFGQSPQAEPPPKRPSGEAARLLHSALAKVTEAEDEEGTSAQARASADGTAGSTAVPVDEVKEWPARLSALRAGKLGFQASAPSSGATMRWVREAAEDPKAELSSDIIAAGTTYLCSSLATARRIPEAVAQQRLEVLGALKDADREVDAAKVSEALTTVRFLQELDNGSKSLAVHQQTPERMPKYVGTMLGKVTAWPMRKGFLEHFAQAVRSGWPATCFAQHGGLELLTRWLREGPESLDKGWPGVADALGALAAAAASVGAESATELLPLLHAAAQRFSSPLLASGLLGKVESAMVQVVVSGVTSSKHGVPKVLEDFARPKGEPWHRFFVTLEILRKVCNALESARDTGVRRVVEWQRAKADFRESTAAMLAGVETSGAWKALSLMEDRMIQTVEAKFDDLEGKAKERESAEEAKKQRERQAAFEKEVASLVSLIGDGQLRDATHGGLEVLIAAMREVRFQVDSGLKSPQALPALKAAEAAGKRFCEQPERRSRQLRWLQRQGFGCCSKLLETRGLLDGLGALAEECQGSKQLPERWRAAGLPRRVCSGLLAAVASGRLRQNRFDILDNEVPNGWSREFSQSVGLHYFQRMYGKGTQWEWPTETDPPEAIGEPPEPESMACPLRPGAARYVGEEAGGSLRCLLCGVAGREHFKDPVHKVAVHHWDRLGDAVQAMRTEFLSDLGLVSQTALGSGATELVGGLELAWFAELAHGLSAAKAPDAVYRTFWHRVVRPCMPNQSHVAAILSALHETLRAARAGEPELGPVLPEAAGTAEKSAASAAVEIGQQVMSKLGPKGGVAAIGASANTELIPLLRALKAALNECGEQRRPACAKEALRAGREAVQHFYERPVRQRRGQEWLQRHGLGHCVQLLEEAGLLDRLPNVAAAPEVVKGLDVPEQCVECLTAALADGRLIEEDMRPGLLPAGWESVISSSTGLRYFTHGDGRQQWEWPEAG